MAGDRVILGILTVRRRNGRGAPFLGRVHLFRKLSHTGRRKDIIVCVLPVDSVLQESLSGWVRTKNRWVYRKLPWPDVVYNKVSDRRLERSLSVKRAKETIRQKGIPLFNPDFIYKGDLFLKLKGNPSVKEHLPRTATLGRGKQGYEQLLAFLKRFRIVYLKPKDGKAGDGIIRIFVKTGTGYLTYYDNNMLKQYSFTSLIKAWQVVNRLIGSRGYIIQQGILLPVFEGSLFDFRVLVQKNGWGRWQVTGIGVRLAGNGRHTTHVPRGGRIESATKVLHSVWPQEESEIEQEIKELALEVARTVEDSYGLFGEMSMDMAVDRKGRVWIFEVNSKPMKFDEPEIDRSSIDNVLEFARCLASSR